jgi:hypothetical protein
MTEQLELKVWWIPQVPGKAFEVLVETLSEADLLLDVLAIYDQFQLDNNIKPDYCNVGGLMVLEEGEWLDWIDEETGDDFDTYRENNFKRRLTND